MEKEDKDSIWGQPKGLDDSKGYEKKETRPKGFSDSSISEDRIAGPTRSRQKSFNSGEDVGDKPNEKAPFSSTSNSWFVPNGFYPKGIKSGSFTSVPVKERPISRSVSNSLTWSNWHKKDVISSAYFIAVNGNGSTKVFPVLNGQSVGSIWGTSDVPDIALSAAADRAQGRVVLEEGRLWYQNESARISTFHNGIQPMDSRFELQYGDIIRLHDFLDVKCLNDTLLILVDHYPKDISWSVFSFSSIAGKSNKIKFKDTNAPNRTISFSPKNGGVSFEDTPAGAEIRINNHLADETRQLAQTDVLQLGDAFFICLGDLLVFPSNWIVGKKAIPPDSTKGALEIHIKDRTVREGLSGQKKLLSDIRLSIPKGSLVLVLGGSGAGKTTFVNAVMGYEPANGVIRYDGIDVYKEYSKMKYEIGYVQQEDLLRKTDVVLNTLMDAARMHLPRDRKEQGRAVSETLKLLGLEQEQKKLVGQLSGGQRKRLSIGVEYVGAPSLFFLDEPDSGLDGSNADNMWEIVRKIADTGKIVMVISHIPDRAFDRFDMVIVLAKDGMNCGRLAFTGSPENACSFFETERLEEIVRRVNRVSEGGEGRADEFIERFEQQRRLA